MKFIVQTALILGLGFGVWTQAITLIYTVADAINRLPH